MGTTNGRFLLGLLIGLLAGGATAHFVSGNKTSAAEPAAALLPQESAQGPQAPTSRPEAPAASSERSAARALPAAQSAPKVTSEELGGLMSNLDTSPTVTDSGSGVISGEVLDENGDGLPGVLLRLSSSRSASSAAHRRVGQGAPELGTLEEAVRRSAESFKANRATTRDTRTDSAGAYKFQDLSDGKWSVIAYLPEYNFKASGSSTGIRVGSELDFTGIPVSSIPASLVGPNGAAVSEAILQVKTKGSRYGAKRYEWTLEDPNLKLVPGEYEVSAFADGSGSLEDYRLASEPQDVTVLAETPSDALRFELRARLGVRGVLRVSKGDPVSDRYYVRLMPLAPEQEVNLKLLAGSEKRESVRAGAEYAFLELTKGRFAVGVSRGWNSSILHHLVVDVTDRVVQADLNIPALDRSQFIRVIVQKPTGETVEGVKFNLFNDSDNNFGYGQTETIRDNDGSYLVDVDGESADLYWGSSSVPAQFKLRVEHEKYGKRTVELAHAQSELVVTFSEPGSITATIAGYQGSGYEGRLSVRAKRVGADPLAGLMMSGRDDKVGPDGTKLIEGLDPGMYEISLVAAPKDGARRFLTTNSLDSIELEVFAGENAVQLSIPALFSLRIHWPDGKEGTDMYLSDPTASTIFGNMNPATLDADGYGTWEDLKAGQYLIRAGSGHMEIAVPCSDLEFEAMEVNALRVVVSDASGDLAKLGFVSGDLIIGADGEEFASKPSTGTLLSLGKQKGGEKTYIVLRDGGQLEITAKSDDIRGWRELGGQLLPATR